MLAVLVVLGLRVTWLEEMVVQRPLYHAYRASAGYLGGWAGGSDPTICEALTGMDAAIWSQSQEQAERCSARIWARFIEHYTGPRYIVYFTALAAMLWSSVKDYLLLNSPREEHVLIAAALLDAANHHRRNRRHTTTPLRLTQQRRTPPRNAHGRRRQQRSSGGGVTSISTSSSKHRTPNS